MKSILRQLHLILSSIIVIPTGLIYGLAPTTLLSQHLDIQVQTVDLANLLRALMFLYIGVSGVWILGIFKPDYWKIATQLNMLFMFTLAMGRLLSIALDGLPTGGYRFGIIAELVLGLFAAHQLKKYKKESNKEFLHDT